MGLNISVSTALYALVLLHHGFHEELKNCAVLAKLAMVKGIVALGCYQAVALSVLVHFRVVHSDHWFSSEEITWNARLADVFRNGDCFLLARCLCVPCEVIKLEAQ